MKQKKLKQKIREQVEWLERGGINFIENEYMELADPYDYDEVEFLEEVANHLEYVEKDKILGQALREYIHINYT